MNLAFVEILLLIAIFIIFFYQQWKIRKLNDVIHEQYLVSKQEKLFCNYWVDCFMDKVYDSKDKRTVAEKAKEIDEAIKKMEVLGLEFEKRVNNGEI